MRSFAIIGIPGTASARLQRRTRFTLYLWDLAFGHSNFIETNEKSNLQIVGRLIQQQQGI